MLVGSGYSETVLLQVHEDNHNEDCFIQTLNFKKNNLKLSFNNNSHWHRRLEIVDIPLTRTNLLA